jgi:anti-anti-sigma factor
MTTLLTRDPDRTATAPTSPTVVVAPSADTGAAPHAVPPLAPVGDLARSSTSRLEQRLVELAATGADDVEVDLSQVTSMDTAVARMLLRRSWRLGDPGRRLLLLHPSPQVRRVLRFVGAGHLLVR